MATDPQRSSAVPDSSTGGSPTKWRANGVSVLGIIFLVLALALLVYASAWYVIDPPGPARADGGAYAIAFFAALTILTWDMVRMGYPSRRRDAADQASRVYGIIGWLLLRVGILVLMFHLVVLFGMATVPSYEREKLGRFRSVAALEVFGRGMPAAAALVLLILPGWYFGRKSRRQQATPA